MTLIAQPPKKTNPKRKPVVHVVPDNDEREHVVDETGKCWCEPKRVRVGPDKILRVTHQSADCREAVENNIGELLAPDKTWSVITA